MRRKVIPKGLGKSVKLPLPFFNWNKSRSSSYEFNHCQRLEIGIITFPDLFFLLSSGQVEMQFDKDRPAMSPRGIFQIRFEKANKRVRRARSISDNSVKHGLSVQTIASVLPINWFSWRIDPTVNPPRRVGQTSPIGISMTPRGVRNQIFSVKS